MKRLLILSLLMIQGLWGAAAAGADDYEGVAQQPVTVITSDGKKLPYQAPGWSSTINNLVGVLPDLVEAIPVKVTDTAFALVQDLYQQIQQNSNQLLTTIPDWINDPQMVMKAVKAANYLDVTVGLEAFITALYVAWLNADTTRPIIVRQNAEQACQQMGIDNVPAEWAQLVVDVSDCLDQNQITNLNNRGNSISWLVRTRQRLAVHSGVLNLSDYRLAVFDLWSMSDDIKSQINIIHLHNNDSITTLASDTFRGFNALTTLDLNSNKIAVIHANAFNGLGNLIHLNLSRNMIETIHAYAFAGLSALKKLHLFNNNIKTLKAGAFIGLSALTELDLGYNNITVIHAYAFNGLGNLTKLYLNNNKLADLPDYVFSELRSLSTLNLLHNPLSQISMFQLPLSYIMPWRFLDSNDQFNLDLIKKRRPQWFVPPFFEL